MINIIQTEFSVTSKTKHIKQQTSTKRPARNEIAESSLNHVFQTLRPK